jgi:hypothetical protein
MSHRLRRLSYVGARRGLRRSRWSVDLDEGRVVWRVGVAGAIVMATLRVKYPSSFHG